MPLTQNRREQYASEMRRDAVELSLAATIVDVTRELARSLPPPRGAPYFWLDSDAPYDLSALDTFCERGIFRKYEFALDLGGGLGGRARWLAVRRGCRILGVDPRLSVVAAAAMLNRRAHMDAQVTFQVGSLNRLPLRARVFTHVWMVDATDDARSAETLAEGFRVLRPGGHFAMQCVTQSTAGRGEWVEILRSIGYVNLEVRDTTFGELPTPCRVARDRLLAALPSGLGEAMARKPLDVHAGVQIFATRPA